MTVTLARRYDDPRAAGQVATAIGADNPNHIHVRVARGAIEIRVAAPSAASARATLEDLMACVQAAERTIGLGRVRPRGRTDRERPIPSRTVPRSGRKVAALDETVTRDILTRARTIAVVGLSDKAERDSNEVARYLMSKGYRVIPVNPMLPEILGERSYPSLSAVPESIPIDIVDIFRRSDRVPPIVEEALARKIPTIWLQLGVESPEAAAKARAGVTHFYQNTCIMQDHRRLGIPARAPGT